MIIASLILMSAAHCAAPKLGDSTTYEMHMTQSPQATGTLSWTIATLNETGNSATLNQHLALGTTVGDSVIQSAYQSLTLNDRVLASCGSFGGVLEAVDVPAGHFNTCRLHQTSGELDKTTWVGPVAVLGIVKMTQTTKRDGATTELDLRASQR